MNGAVPSASAGAEVAVSAFARSLSVAEVLILGLICLALVIFLRWVSKFPSELDRIGADVSLYACGSAFSLFAAAFLEQGVFKGTRKEDVLFVGTSGILLSLMSYFSSLYFSEGLRKHSNPLLPSGIDDWDQLTAVLHDPQCARYLKRAVGLGLVPGTFFFVLDILRSLT
jgi:hypothetical protein